MIFHYFFKLGVLAFAQVHFFEYAQLLHLLLLARIYFHCLTVILPFRTYRSVSVAYLIFRIQTVSVPYRTATAKIRYGTVRYEYASIRYGYGYGRNSKESEYNFVIIIKLHWLSTTVLAINKWFYPNIAHYWFLF